MALRKLIAIGLSVPTFALAAAQPTMAQGAPGCSVDADGNLHCGGETPGDGPTSPPGDSPTGPSLYRVEVNPLGFVCVLGQDDDDELYEVLVFWRSTGALVSREVKCIRPGDPAPAPPPPPPSPPQIIEGFDTIGTLKPELLPQPAGVNGSPGSPVQFEAWGWCVPPDDPVVEITLGPWRARAEMHIVELGWSVTGVEPFATKTTTCGTPQAPESTGAGAPFKWTPHKAGDFTVTLTARWTGTAQYWYQGRLAGTADMGTYEHSSQVAQHIYEIEVVNN